MKTKTLYLILAGTLAFFTPKVNAQTLIQYWDFNATLPVGGAGGDSLGNATNPLTANQVVGSLTAGHIIFSRVGPAHLYNPTVKDSFLDNGTQGTGIYDYTTTEDTGGTAAGNLFVRARNPSDSNEMFIYIPTTGYKNIMFDFAISSSSTKGANYGIFAYSTNGGTSWQNLTTAMDTFNISGTKRPDTLQLQNPITAASGWYPVQMNFTSDASVNNNANFVIKMMLAGPNTHEQTGGNARFDNFAIWGTSISSGIAKVNEASGYSVYPNPASANSGINIVSQYTGNKIVTLYDALGQVVCSTTNHDIETTLYPHSLKAGIYIVEVNELSTGNKYTQKVVIQ